MTPQQHTTPDSGAVSLVAGVGLRLASLGALWLVLTGGDVTRSWGVGVATVCLATLATYRVGAANGGRLRVSGALRFVPYFLYKTATGALDVGLRALAPSIPLAPALVNYELRIRPDSSARVFFMAVISLLPGTLTADIVDDTVCVHVIDREWPIREQLAKLEELVADIFGESVGDGDTTGGPA